MWHRNSGGRTEKELLTFVSVKEGGERKGGGRGREGRREEGRKGRERTKGKQKSRWQRHI